MYVNAGDFGPEFQPASHLPPLLDISIFEVQAFQVMLEI